MRESPALDVMALLHQKGATVQYARSLRAGAARRATGTADSTCTTEPLDAGGARRSRLRRDPHRSPARSTTTWSCESARADRRHAQRDRRRAIARVEARARRHRRFRARPHVAGRRRWRSPSWSLIVLDLRSRFVAYVYAGYPGAAARSWAAASRPPAGPPTPSAGRRCRRVDRHRGAQRRRRGWPARIDNLLSLDYPPARARSSSSPTARPTTRPTCSARYRPFVELDRGAARRKGAGAERRRARAAQFDIVVFADARQVFAPDALRRARRAVSRTRNRRRDGRAAARLRIGALREPAQRKTAPRPASMRGPSATPNRAATAGSPTSSRRSATASACTGDTKSTCGGSRARSDRRSAPPARSTRCGARLWRRCRPTRFSTTCWRRCAWCMAGFRVVFDERARVRPRGRRCRRRVAAQGPDARRQLSRFWGSSRGSCAVAQPGVVPVRVAQDRTAARAVCAARGFFSSLALAQHSVFYLSWLPARWHSSRSRATARCWITACGCRRCTTSSACRTEGRRD